MAHNEQQQHVVGLESQLRSMILSNAPTGPPTAPPGIQYPAHQSARYASPSHGSGHHPRHHPHHPHKLQQQQPYHGPPATAAYQSPPAQNGDHYQRQQNIPPENRSGYRQFQQNGHSQHQRNLPPANGTLPSHQRNAPPRTNDGSLGVRQPPHLSQSQHYPQRHAGRLNSDVFQRHPPRGPAPQRQRPQQLFNPLTTVNGPGQTFGSVNENQWQYLEQVASQEIPLVQMAADELQLKETFRVMLEKTCQSLKSPDPDSPLPAIELHGFGSLSSGFASAGSDMDVAIVTNSSEATEQQVSMHENSLPRVLEKELLRQGIGARLLTRTRVPIIKVCEKPSPELLNALRKERESWDSLSDDGKYRSEKAPSEDTPSKADGTPSLPDSVQVDATKGITTVQATIPNSEEEVLSHETSSQDSQKTNDETALPLTNASKLPVGHLNKQRTQRPWTRERVGGLLDFPKDGVGIQCDINFFNPLGIHNTKMLRCYSKCDTRVRPMILFIKAWAKRRKINSSYSGTLSSYGYVLMVLHYLVNIARPPVLPNLQLEAHRMGLRTGEVDGWEVNFYDDEDEIVRKASLGGFSQNKQPVGALLLGFFQYYAQPAAGQGFIWMSDVLSLRTPGGILTKQEKGWTGAKTEKGDNKEVRHRYLFAIEDPFELTHNVARTVSHPGICAIRDEFRRTWRILCAVGRHQVPHDGELFEELQEKPYEAPPRAQQPVPAHTSPPMQVAAPAKAEDYSQAFPSLGGPTKTAGPHTKKQNTQTNNSNTHTGVISGKQAKAHLETFKRGKQLAPANRNTPGGAVME